MSENGNPALTLVTTQTGRPAWQVNGYAAVKDFSRDPRLSDSDPKLVQTGGTASGEARDAIERADSLGWSNVLRRAFSPERVDTLESQITDFVNGLLTEIAAGSRPPDLHHQLAVPMVSFVTCALLGVPEEHGRRFRSWWEAVKTGDRAEAQRGQAALLGYVRDLMAAKRREPGDDFVSTLIHAEGNSPSYTDRAVKFLTGLISKGRETPVNALDWGLVLLLRDPTEYDCVVRDRTLLGPAVEEILRLFPVISGKIQGPEGIRRFALTNFVESASEIKRGDLMLLNVVGANMDAEMFPDAERFDLRRPANPHVTFGFGPHACPASRLARLELTVALGALLERFPQLRLGVGAADLRYKERPTSEGFESLPVTW